MESGPVVGVTTRREGDSVRVELAPLGVSSLPAPRSATGSRVLCVMQSKGLIEFRYANGGVVTGDYSQYASRSLIKGDQIEYDGATWLMYDREDRGGVTVHLFSPTTAITPTEGLRARQRRR